MNDLIVPRLAISLVLREWSGLPAASAKQYLVHIIFRQVSVCGPIAYSEHFSSSIAKVYIIYMYACTHTQTLMYVYVYLCLNVGVFMYVSVYVCFDVIRIIECLCLCISRLTYV